jgi:hypothetical protein
MAHWAQIDKNNIVVSVIVTENNDDEGQGWISENLEGTWLKTSYNTRLGKHLFDGEPFRKNFAQPGYYYDSNLDAFIPPKNYPSWILDEESCNWMPPIPYPESEGTYEWNEETISWKEIDIENDYKKEDRV